MKNLIDTIKNIWRIEELRSRILITLGLLLVYRIGSFIVLPGVDSARLAASGASGGGGIVEILSIFTGGAFTRASIFALKDSGMTFSVNDKVGLHRFGSQWAVVAKLVAT